MTSCTSFIYDPLHFCGLPPGSVSFCAVKNLLCHLHTVTLDTLATYFFTIVHLTVCPSVCSSVCLYKLNLKT